MSSIQCSAILCKPWVIDYLIGSFWYSWIKDFSHKPIFINCLYVRWITKIWSVFMRVHNDRRLLPLLIKCPWLSPDVGLMQDLPPWCLLQMIFLRQKFAIILIQNDVYIQYWSNATKHRVCCVIPEVCHANCSRINLDLQNLACCLPFYSQIKSLSVHFIHQNSMELVRKFGFLCLNQIMHITSGLH